MYFQDMEIRDGGGGGGIDLAEHTMGWGMMISE